MEKYNHLEIKKLRAEGKTFSQIKKIIGCSSGTVSYILCKRDDSVVNKRGRKLSLDKREELNKLYAEGQSLQKIHNILGIAVQTIKKYLTAKKPPNKPKRRVILEFRRRIKQKLIDYKGGCCVNCGYKKCIAALHFHHVDPKTKSFNITTKSIAFDKLKKEADKCILLCSNCHAEEHLRLHENKQIL